MPHNPNKDHARYIVRGPGGQILSYDTAGDVAIAMWGRDGNKWSVYMNLEPLPLEVGALRDELKRLNEMREANAASR